MKLQELLGRFHLEKVRLNLSVFGLEMSFEEADKNAAWELYIEMLTRIVTQPLPNSVGDGDIDDNTAIESTQSARGSVMTSYGTLPSQWCL